MKAIQRILISFKIERAHDSNKGLKRYQSTRVAGSNSRSVSNVQSRIQAYMNYRNDTPAPKPQVAMENIPTFRLRTTKTVQVMKKWKEVFTRIIPVPTVTRPV